MNEYKPVLKDVFMASLPPPWPDKSLQERIAKQVTETRRCIVALDDDPTGTQTVHDIWVLTNWEVKELEAALADNEPALYILTNTRSMPLAEAKSVNRTIAANLTRAAREVSRPITVVSRSDSTLRGHYPGEVDALEKALVKSGMPAFDGVCIIPFFPEGGRFTAHDVHWVQEGDRLTPAAQTPYAQDPVFGYTHSHLKAWVEEKTKGRIPASKVISISIESLRKGGPEKVAAELKRIEKGSVIIVNALAYRDLEVFVTGLLGAEVEGKRFLFRTAASFVKVAAGISDKPLLTRDELLKGRDVEVGLIIIGSYVPKSTAQLEALRTLEGVEGIELSVDQVLDETTRMKMIINVADKLNNVLAAGTDAVIFTSRQIVVGGSHEDNLSIGRRVSSALMEIVQRIKIQPKYVIGKGGITSSDLATDGLRIRAARVLGQIYPGVPVWELGPNSRWPGMPYIVFPGNVGKADTLAEIVLALRG